MHRVVVLSSYRKESKKERKKGSKKGRRIYIGCFHIDAKITQRKFELGFTIQVDLDDCVYRFLYAWEEHLLSL